MVYIGLDVGTSGCKAAAFSADGTKLASYSENYDLISEERGWAELDAEAIWQGIKLVLRRISPLCANGGAIAVSGIGEAFVLTDAQGKPLNRFITYLDNRGDQEMLEIRSRYSDWDIYRLTGVYPNKTYSLCRLQWLRNNVPQLLSQAKCVMFYNEYFTYKLSGKRAVDPGTAVRSLCAVPGGSAWCRELIDFIGMDESVLAPILPVGTPLGCILPELAEELGLPEDFKIILGCHDQCAAVLGAGAWKMGDAMLGEGSSESLNLVVDEQAASPSRIRYENEIVAEPYLEGKHILLAAQSAFCTNLRWFMRNISKEGVDEEASYAYYDANSPEETDLIFVPYLSSLNVMDTQTNVHGAFLGLRFSSTREEMYRAVLEGMHMESRRNLEKMNQMGVPFGKLIANGGNSRSELSMQIKADILRQDLYTLAVPDAGAMGLAMICAVADGAHSSYEQAIEAFVRYGRHFVPGRDYEDAYGRYLTYTEALRNAEIKLSN